jgi:hypothetical protein
MGLYATIYLDVTVVFIDANLSKMTGLSTSTFQNSRGMSYKPNTFRPMVIFLQDEESLSLFLVKRVPF